MSTCTKPNVEQETKTFGTHQPLQESGLRAPRTRLYGESTRSPKLQARNEGFHERSEGGTSQPPRTFPDFGSFLTSSTTISKLSLGGWPQGIESSAPRLADSSARVESLWRENGEASAERGAAGYWRRRRLLRRVSVPVQRRRRPPSCHVRPDSRWVLGPVLTPMSEWARMRGME